MKSDQALIQSDENENFTKVRGQNRITLEEKALKLAAVQRRAEVWQLRLSYADRLETRLRLILESYVQPGKNWALLEKHSSIRAKEWIEVCK